MKSILSENKISNFVTISPDENDTNLLSLDSNEIKNLFQKHGAILFRGFDLDVDNFGQFARKFCSHSIFNEGRNRKMLDQSSNVQTVNKGQRAFELHAEMAREPWKPDVCFFGALQPPASGGETTICDGSLLVEKLPEEILNEISSRGVCYPQPFSAQESQFWLSTATPTLDIVNAPPKECPYEFFVQNNQVIRLYKTPFLHIPMFTKKPSFGNFLLFGRYQLQQKAYPRFENLSLIPEHIAQAIRATGERLTVPIQWQQGDVAMIDNTRFLHGRRHILDTDQRLIMSYFGYLKDAVIDEQDSAADLWRNPSKSDGFTRLQTILKNSKEQNNGNVEAVSIHR